MKLNSCSLDSKKKITHNLPPIQTSYFKQLSEKRHTFPPLKKQNMTTFVHFFKSIFVKVILYKLQSVNQKKKKLGDSRIIRSKLQRNINRTYRKI